MAPLKDFSPKKVLLLYLALIFVTSLFISASTEGQPQKSELFFGRRRMLELQDEEEQKPIVKKKTTSTSTGSLLSTKNQTKSVKNSTSSSSKNQTKLIKTGSIATKNQTKLIKIPSESTEKFNKTKLIKPISSDSSSTLKVKNPTIKILLKKLNSTSSKSSNSTKNSSLFPKGSLDPTKTSSAKNKTTKPKTTATSNESKTLLDKNLSNEPKSKSKTQDTNNSSDKKPKSEKSPKQTLPSWVDQNDDDDDDDDLVSEFRDLPTKFQETLIPDLDRISQASKLYLTKTNKEMTRGFKPIVGNKYAPTIASFTSFAFILIPLILVSLIFNKIKAYFSLQKILIFIQIYLSIYFSILCLSSLVTGLEPLRFFYATSQSTYVCLQVLQTLAYVLYLLLLLMYMILVFSTETGLATKLLGLGQTFVGFSVGLHYYMMVFHRAVLHQPPKTSWKVHAIYATCFLLICVLTRADRRKKAYFEGGAEGKLS